MRWCRLALPEDSRRSRSHSRRAEEERVESGVGDPREGIGEGEGPVAAGVVVVVDVERGVGGSIDSDKECARSVHGDGRREGSHLSPWPRLGDTPK